MAIVTANYWGYEFWASALEVYQRDVSTAYDELWYRMQDVADAEITSGTNTTLKGRTYDGGTVQVYGKNFNSYDYDNIVITRMSLQGTGADFNLTGDLRLGGYLGFYGTINSIELQMSGVSFFANGQFSYDWYGNYGVTNATETIRLANGVSVTSYTDSAGDYIRHDATVGEHQLSIQGRWGYENVESWDSLLAGSDELHGTVGHDYLKGFSGNDILFGGDGIDTAVFQGSMHSYQVKELSEGRFTVTDNLIYRDGSDTLDSIERLAFNDGVIAWDTDANGIAGKAYRIYQAAFDRTPDSSGLGYWVKQMDEGMELVEVAARFIDSAEFRSVYGLDPSHDEFLYRLYTNVLDREPDASGYDWWLNQLNTNPEKTWERVLADFSESPENQQNVIQITGSIIEFDLIV